MKANNLTISVPAECQLNCPYCVSKMTFAPKPNACLFKRNLTKARELARAARVSSVLVTSKGEPLLADIELLRWISFVFKSFPLEIQTNAIALTPEMIDWLYDHYFNTVAISLTKPLSHYHLQLTNLKNKGLISRITIVLTDLPLFYDSLIDDCISLGVKQLTLRRATVPKVSKPTQESRETTTWINNNTKSKYLDIINYIKDHDIIRTLSFNSNSSKGTAVYDIEGIAVTIIDYCIQEKHSENDIRSLIYHQDGHMYTSWDKPSSILF